MSKGREVSLISDRDLARKRLPIWAGSDMPQTIVMKELIDNEIDVVNERSQAATKAIFKIGPERIKLMDNGHGISTSVKEGTNKTNLWLACAKMFTSSNYDGVSESVGANGVGMTMANFTSKRFIVMNFNGRSVKGYAFTDGFLDGTENCPNKEDGDFVENPLSYKEANEKFDPFFENGFLVDVLWEQAPNSLFPESGKIDWLVNYTKIRVGEIVSGEVEVFVYDDNNFEKEINHYVWNKDKNSENYVKSWDEKVKEENGVVLKKDPWTVAFFMNQVQIDSVVQGAPINSRFITNATIQIQDWSASLKVPVTIKYLSADYPNYADQTKVNIRYPYTVVGNLFEKSGEVYKYFYKEAEKAYLARVISDSTMSQFWPSLRPPEESELIIAEGYSAISGLKAQRDANTQACIALKGKILNCWNLPMVKAMNSEVVKQILNAVLYSKYQRIILAVDADPDGSHIAALLISLFARFTNIIQEGKLMYVHTPHYIFKKRGQPIQWSDKASVCPPGYHVTTLKGLGGMESNEIFMFIMNKETRKLVNIEWDGSNSENALDHAFSGGGEDWII